MSSRKRTAETRPARSKAPGDSTERLQKILAAAGAGSRRHCEELIQAGRVTVDGKLVTNLGAKADPRRQTIELDGTPLARPRRVYFAVHKPQGVVSSSRDPAGRPRVIDLVGYPERLFTVGRLDLSSEGLILVTNDGELANRLAHPRYGVEKTYQVQVAGVLDGDEVRHLRKGVHLADGFVRVASIRIKQRHKQSTLLEIVLAEGRNREIRRLLARRGHKVLRLKRVALGPLRLANLPPGAVRPLTREEVRKLTAAADSTQRAGRRPPRSSLASSKDKSGTAKRSRRHNATGATKAHSRVVRASGN